MRLDAYLFENKLFPSRTKAAEAVKMGEITLNGSIICQPSKEVSISDEIKIVEKVRYVSNGGYKLEKAISAFEINFNGLRVIDVGASTGGFTDCLLRNGVLEVCALDVGENLLDQSLRENSRVKVVENYNARLLKSEDFDCLFDAAVVDCSFISLKQILPSINNVLKSNGFVVALIKPQFECGRAALSKNGVVISKKLRQSACEDLYCYAVNQGFVPKNFTQSPLNLRKNHEYLLLLDKSGTSMPIEKIYEEIIKEV